MDREATIRVAALATERHAGPPALFRVASTWWEGWWYGLVMGVCLGALGAAYVLCEVVERAGGVAP